MTARTEAEQDSLDLPSAVLVGHSFAGMEISPVRRDASRPLRRLVYVDAAYDNTHPGIERVFTETPPPLPPPLTAADSASFEAVRAYADRKGRSGRLPVHQH